MVEIVPAEDKLLTREEFRKKCLHRDGHRCSWCGRCPSGGATSIVVHHILERRLFSDGGYYLGNGASLCFDCHWKAETTEISAQQLRDKIGIKKVILPEHLYEDEVYDKWGNILLPNGNRIKGELFEDESVQKALEDSLPMFIDYVKYPRTYHLPWTEKTTKDDRVLTDVSHFKGKDVVVTLKMDGENSTLYHDYSHARSLDSKNHVSRNWLKNFHAGIKHNIPKGFRICGENLYAKHTIFYPNLKTFFYGFSLWDEYNYCFDWDLTLEWFALLDILPVPTLYRGPFDQDVIHQLFLEQQKEQPQEGYVIRLSDRFHYSQFRNSVAKFVSNTFQIDPEKHHWFFGAQTTTNQLGK